MKKIEFLSESNQNIIEKKDDEEGTESNYEQNLLELFEVLFGNFGVHRIVVNNLISLSNEHNLLKILQEIEPEFNSIAEVDEIELMKDTDPGSNISENNQNKSANKYSNFLELFSCLSKYLSNNPNKSCFKTSFNLDSLFNIKDLTDYKKDSETNKTLIVLAEIILVISAISTKKGDYLDTLYIMSESEPKYLNNYINIIEKFIEFNKEKDDDDNNNNNNNKISATPQRYMTKSLHDFSTRKTSIVRRMTIIRKDKMNYLNNIETMEREINELNIKNRELTDILLDFEMKYRDVLRENETLKFSSTQHLQIEEDLYNDALAISNLKNELMKKEFELEDVKRDYEIIIKNQKEDIAKMNHVKDNLEDKIDEFKSVKFDNEKLKLKIKELNMNKEKLQEFDNMTAIIEAKNKQIENLIKEKQNFISLIEKVTKENLLEKGKIKDFEYEKKKLEYELYELKKDIKKETRRNTYVRNPFINDSRQHSLNEKTLIKNALNEKSGIYLDKIHNFSNVNEESLININKDTSNENKIKDLEEEIQDLKIEVKERDAMFKEQIGANHKLIEENSILQSKVENLIIEIDNLVSEKEKILIEKEKVEISKQRSDLELQKMNLTFDKLDNDKNKLIDEVAQLTDKIEDMNLVKNNFLKEIDGMKVLLKIKSNQIDKILSEKQVLINEYQNLQINFDKVKKVAKDANINAPPGKSLNKDNNSQKQSKIQKNSTTSAGSPKNSLGSDANDMKVEISRLKANLTSKDDTIKQLKDRIKQLEKLEDIIKSKENKNEQDLQYYKKSYEDQKLKTNQEHELLSNNLCDLAMQLMTFKNELLKNVKPSILQHNNISIN